MDCGRDVGSTKLKFVLLCLYISREYTGPLNYPVGREMGMRVRGFSGSGNLCGKWTQENAQESKPETLKAKFDYCKCRYLLLTAVTGCRRQGKGLQLVGLQ